MERFDIIKNLIKARGYQSYLEIGVRQRETIGQIDLPVVDGVDPNGQGNYTMTSDEFFANHCDKIYDIIFIDGLHLYEQVKKDIENSLVVLKENGIIVVHDCLPEEEWQQLREGVPGRPWNGDVWKAFADLRCERKDLFMATVDTDWGCGLIERGSQLLYPPVKEWTWEYFKKNSHGLMNIITIREFIDGYTQS